DDHLPADGINPQLAALVGIQLDRMLAGPETPGLRIVHGRRAGRRRDQIVDLIGRDRHRPPTGVRGHALYLPARAVIVAHPGRCPGTTTTGQYAWCIT